MIPIAIGFDQREAISYHVFCQSILEKSSQPVAFTPLVLAGLASLYEETHEDASNSFIYSRFLTPFLFKYSGWAVYADSDMVCQHDIGELWALRDNQYAVMVVAHDYKTKHQLKYLGNVNQDYPRKNWSSLILWNCSHPKNRLLTPSFVSGQSGAFLHRFSWLENEEIGRLPLEWNWLTTEYPDNFDAHLLHYTLGSPCFRDYAKAPMSGIWHLTHRRSQQGLGDS